MVAACTPPSYLSFRINLLWAYCITHCPPPQFTFHTLLSASTYPHRQLPVCTAGGVSTFLSAPGNCKLSKGRDYALSLWYPQHQSLVNVHGMNEWSSSRPSELSMRESQ